MKMRRYSRRHPLSMICLHTTFQKKRLLYLRYTLSSREPPSPSPPASSPHSSSENYREDFIFNGATSCTRTRRSMMNELENWSSSPPWYLPPTPKLTSLGSFPKVPS